MAFCLLGQALGYPKQTHTLLQSNGILSRYFRIRILSEWEWYRMHNHMCSTPWPSDFWPDEETCASVIKTSCVYHFVRWVQGLAPDISCVLLKCKQIQQKLWMQSKKGWNPLLHNGRRWKSDVINCETVRRLYHTICQQEYKFFINYPPPFQLPQLLFKHFAHYQCGYETLWKKVIFRQQEIFFSFVISCIGHFRKSK